ncbi:MAG TPA: ABC transporter substrate-binding protein [Nitrolancea sp.]
MGNLDLGGLRSRMNRRQLLQWSALGISGAAAASLLAACGGGSGSTPTSAAATSGSNGSSTQAPSTGTGGTPSSGGTAVTGSPSASGTGTSAATAASTSKPAVSDKSVRIAQGVDIKTFDPHEDTSSAGIAVFQNVFDNLLAIDQNMVLGPSLAEKWENINDTTWEFKLRQGVKFHDGTPFTAKDIAFSFNHVLDPASKSRQYSNIAPIDHAEAVDDFTLHLITKAPLAPLLDETRNIFALPADMYQSMGAAKFALAPVGTGPYKFKEWVKDQHVLVERYDDHWRGKAVLASAEFRPIAEDATRVAALQAGEIDIATIIPPDQAEALKSDSALDVRAVRSLRIIFIGMNCFKDPLTNVKVRQALNYAVDVPSIIKNLFNGHAYQTTSIIGPNIFGFDPDIKPYEYDPDKAKSLLAEAGFPDGFSTVLDTPQGRYIQDVEVAQAVSGFLAKVGVKAEVRPADFNEFFDRWLAKKMEGLYLLGSGGGLDGDSLMGSHFDGKRRGLYYNSPQSDDLIHQAYSELDPKKRLALYYQLDEYLKDQAPWIYLYEQEDTYGVVKNLNWKPQPDERLWAWDMSFNG